MRPAYARIVGTLMPASFGGMPRRDHDRVGSVARPLDRDRVVAHDVRLAPSFEILDKVEVNES
jgi:hypothetical protein